MLSRCSKKLSKLRPCHCVLLKQINKHSMCIISACILSMCPSSSIHWFHYQQVLSTWIQGIWPYLNIIYGFYLLENCQPNPPKTSLKLLKNSLPSVFTTFPFSTQKSSHHFWKAHDCRSSVCIAPHVLLVHFFLSTLRRHSNNHLNLATLWPQIIT